MPPGPLEPRHSAVGAWLGDRWLVVGGASTRRCPPAAGCLPPERRPLRDGATFDPGTGRWQRIGDAPVGFDFATTALVGSVLYVHVPQGRTSTLLGYDVVADRWTRLPPPPGADVTILDTGGRLVSVSGSERSTVHAVFDPVERSWLRLPPDPLGPTSFRDPVWAGDRLLVAAGPYDPSLGRSPPRFVRLAALDADLRRWTVLPDTRTIGRLPALVGRAVVWPDTQTSDGGHVDNWGRAYPHGGILDLVDGSWRSLPRPLPPFGPLCCVVVDGLVSVHGHLLDPVSLRWTRVPRPPGAKRDGATVVASPDLVLLWGGTEDYRANLGTGYLYRP